MLDITITAPFAVGDLVARVDLPGGASERIILRSGRFRGPVAGTPLRVTLTTEPAPAGETPLAWGTPCHEEVPDTAHEGTRFGSWEHIMCGRLVGLGADGSALVCDDVNAWFASGFLDDR